MGIFSSSSKSKQSVTNYNTSATGANNAEGSGASTNLSGLVLSTGAGGKNAAGGALSVTLTDQGAVQQSYNLADRAFDSIESLFLNTSKAWETAQANTLHAFQAANDFTSDSLAKVQGGDPQKTTFLVLAGAAVILAVVLINRSR